MFHPGLVDEGRGGPEPALEIRARCDADDARALQFRCRIDGPFDEYPGRAAGKRFAGDRPDTAPVLRINTQPAPPVGDQVKAAPAQAGAIGDGRFVFQKGLQVQA